MKKLSFFLKSLIFFFSALIVFLSLISYTPKDIVFLTTPPPSIIKNFIGIVGAYLAFGILFVFGKAAYFFPFYLFFLGLYMLGRVRFFGLARSKTVKVISFCLFTIFLSTFIGIFKQESSEVFQASGIIGFSLCGFFIKYLGVYGSRITVFLLLAVNAILLFGLFFVDLFLALRFLVIRSIEFIKNLKEKLQSRSVVKVKQPKPKKERRPLFAKKEKEVKKEAKKEIKPEIKLYTPQVNTQQSVIKPTPKPSPKAIDKEAIKKKVEDLEKQDKKAFDPATYKLPTSGIVKVPPALDYREVKENIQANIKNLEDTLSDFGVEAKVVSVQKGPVVTMYELQPQAGVKIQKISALADDIALAMKSSSVRVVAPLPGRGTVGVEIPNQKKHLVFLREVLDEKIFTSADSKLTLIIGKDVSGNPVIANLKEMPHLLIAGATGSGKTVCVNSLISSILFKAKPDEVKFVLIDPKMVELAPYAGIPHLIHPIISDAKKAFSVLNWAVEEMEKRYRKLAEEGARNIDAYNRKKGDMPYIIIVVDELADLMVVARDTIETAIQRLAQLSRAVGIHLILATQRPSVDVITGVIKANFPARISFKVSSKVDSRTVLDANGADKLLGKGDLLFLKPGAMKLIRAQGAFIDDEDIESLTEYMRSQGGPVHEQGILESEKKRALNIEGDELFDEAVKTILQARQASASILQRRLRVGYTRAARLLDLMEQNGIVGPFCGSKARDILVNPEEYLQEKEAV